MELYEVVTDVASYVGKERINDLYCMKTERLFESNPKTLKGKIPYFWNMMKRPSIATFVFRLSPLDDFLEINKVYYNDL